MEARTHILLALALILGGCTDRETSEVQDAGPHDTAVDTHGDTTPVDVVVDVPGDLPEPTDAATACESVNVTGGPGACEIAAVCGGAAHQLRAMTTAEGTDSGGTAHTWNTIWCDGEKHTWEVQEGEKACRRELFIKACGLDVGPVP